MPRAKRKVEPPASLRPAPLMTVGTAITPAMLRAQAVKNARGLSEMVETARRTTNSGAGGPKGKRHRGYFFHQLVGSFVGLVYETYATDADLQPKADLMTRIFARNEVERPAIMARAAAERAAREATV